MPHLKQVKSVLNKHKKRDSWFLDDYSVNPYEGCSVNCLYCYVRGSKYGENMDDGLAIKSNALEILDKQLTLRARKNEYGFVAVGSATDAYLSHEAKQELTKGMLELLLKHRFPVFISTKSTLIKRDLDLLKQIDKVAILPQDLEKKLGKGLILSVSVSSMNERVSDMLEPGAAKPMQRIELLGWFKKQGFLAGVNALPLLPFISDTEEEIEKIVVAAKENGADYVLAGGLTLFGQGPSDSKTLYYKFLERYDPTLLPKYEALFGSNFYTPFNWQKELKEKTDRIIAKHQLRNSIIKLL